MKRYIHVFALCTAPLLFCKGAFAQASRTFVSTTGNDSNTSATCPVAAPCRTFTAALSVTSPSGEIVVLTSGGYGPATINQPVNITAIGVDASISVTTSFADGLDINTTGNVTLTGLSLHGGATGGNGIQVDQVGSLRLYNMLIEDFAFFGVGIFGTGSVAVYDSKIYDNATGGLQVSNASADAYVRNTSFDHNGYGVEVSAGAAIVADSSSEYNTKAFAANGGTLTLFRDRAALNNVGLSTSNGGALYFADCYIGNNTTSFQLAAGTTFAGTNPGTTSIGSGQAASGVVSPGIGLQ